MVIAFTGHRPQNLIWGFNEEATQCKVMKQNLKKLVIQAIKAGYTDFDSGMALGVDMIAAEIILDIKKQHPELTLKLIGVIPCKGQETRWLPAQKERYNAILEQADETIVLHDEYTPSCMQERNQYLVDHADAVISVWDHSPSGTGNTVEYAKSKRKRVINIHPYTGNIEKL